jgi:hypothetical protein
MHFIRSSIRAETLCANVQRSGTHHFSVRKSVVRFTSVARTPRYPTLLIRIQSPVALASTIHFLKGRTLPLAGDAKDGRQSTHPTF